MDRRTALVSSLALFTSCKPNTAVPDTEIPDYLSVKELLVALHNQERDSSLVLEELLTMAAQDHSNWMAANNKMSHIGENRSSPSERIERTGYEWTTYGENIAYGQKTPEGVMQSWMRSFGHRTNIKNSSYRDIGVGITKNEDEVTYWCVKFGSTRLNGERWLEDNATPVSY